MDVGVLYKTAIGFEGAGDAAWDRVCEQNPQLLQEGLTHSQVAPVMVNHLLATELYLKCLVVLDMGSHERGHDLTRLFDDLSSDTQVLLRSGFLRARTAASPSPADPFEDIRNLFHAVGRAYVQWRYVHEWPDGGGFPGPWSRIAMVVLREAIQNARPDLRD